MCGADEYKNEKCCICMPYKGDGLLLTGQICVAVAFACSFLGGLISVIWATATMSIVLCACCCAMNKCGIITGASFSVVNALISGVSASLYFVASSWCRDGCDSYGTYCYDDDYSFAGVTYYADCSILTAFGAIQILAFILNVTASVVLFMFGCCKLNAVLSKKAAENESNKQSQRATRDVEAVELTRGVVLSTVHESRNNRDKGTYVVDM